MTREPQATVGEATTLSSAELGWAAGREPQCELSNAPDLATCRVIARTIRRTPDAVIAQRNDALSAVVGSSTAASRALVDDLRAHHALTERQSPDSTARRRRLNDRLRAEFMAGAEAEWRNRTGDS